MKNILFGSSRPEGIATQLVYAIFRVFTGLGIALYHGKGKIADLQAGFSEDMTVAEKGFYGDIEALGLPAPMFWAWSVALVEFVGGFLIAAGLLTRLSAFALLTVILTAFIGVHGAYFPEAEAALQYVFASALIVVIGSGKFGIDGAIYRR